MRRVRAFELTCRLLNPSPFSLYRNRTIITTLSILFWDSRSEGYSYTSFKAWGKSDLMEPFPSDFSQRP